MIRAIQSGQKPWIRPESRVLSPKFVFGGVWPGGNRIRVTVSHLRREWNESTWTTTNSKRVLERHLDLPTTNLVGTCTLLLWFLCGFPSWVFLIPCNTTLIYLKLAFFHPIVPTDAANGGLLYSQERQMVEWYHCVLEIESALGPIIKLLEYQTPNARANGLDDAIRKDSSQSFRFFVRTHPQQSGANSQPVGCTITNS